MEKITLIFILLAIGIALKRLHVFPKNTSEVLNQFVIYVSLPALVLLKVPHMQLSSELLAPALVSWILLFLSVILVLITNKFFNWDRPVLAALLLIVPLGNTSFLGIPMVNAYFGEKAISYALMYDQLGSFLALAIYGSIVLAIFSETNIKPTALSVLYKITTFPPFIALIIALLLHFFELPTAYFEVLSPIAATLVPVVMVAVGYQLQLKIDWQQLQPFAVGLSIKMVIAPFMALALFTLFNLNGLVYQVSVFEAAMPPMISAGALAIMANFAPKLTAAMVAYGIVFSFVSLPLFYKLLSHLQLNP